MLDLVLSIVVLAAIALLAGSFFLWRRTGNAKNAALMVVLAFIALINVAIWTVPTTDGEAPLDKAHLARLRHSLARGVFYVDYFKVLSATRDFRAFHRLLVDKGLAVWSGQPFREPASELPDDVGAVVRRIQALF